MHDKFKLLFVVSLVFSNSFSLTRIFFENAISRMLIRNSKKVTDIINHYVHFNLENDRFKIDFTE